MSESTRIQLRHDYGYDRPLPEQYVRYLRNVARGELGWSFNKGEWVSTVLAQALPRTLLLAGTALVLSFVIGVALGVMQAARPGWFDRATSTVVLIFYSLPDFWG